MLHPLRPTCFPTNIRPTQFGDTDDKLTLLFKRLLLTLKKEDHSCSSKDLVKYGLARPCSKQLCQSKHWAPDKTGTRVPVHVARHVTSG